MAEACRFACIGLKQAALGAVCALGCYGSPRAAETTIFQFENPLTCGKFPAGNLVKDTSGNLYGVTQGGSGGYRGSVFELSPPLAGQTAWTCTLVYRFLGGKDGGTPNAGLSRDSSGALYVTTPATSVGGGADFGPYVFKFIPPAAGQSTWTKTTIFDLSSVARSDLFTPITLRPDGALYGMFETETIVAFALAPAGIGHNEWTYKALFTFPPGQGGPAGALIPDSAGNLYVGVGATASSMQGGVIRLSPPAAGQEGWSVTDLYDFQGGTDGNTPTGALAFGSNGSLYGVTRNGGTEGGGTVYQLTPPSDGNGPWTKTIIADLTPQSGYRPFAGVYVSPQGVVYEVNSVGGSRGEAGTGTLLKFIPPATGETMWTQELLYEFPSGMSDAESPLLPGPFNLLYGTTVRGGPKSTGTVYSVAR